MIHVLKPGLHYRIETTAGEYVDVRFGHRNDKDEFINGVMSEDLMEILIHRQNHFVTDMNRATVLNINVLLHLKQAYQFLKERNFSKRKKVENRS